MKLLSTKTAAEQLGVSVRRVQAMIAQGRLLALKIGRDYLINQDDLETVRDRKPGRPKRKND